MSQLTVTHTSTVTEDQIDDLGHMNVRYYALNATRGTRATLESLGWKGTNTTDDVYTRHHREQMLGTDLEVRSAVLSAEPDRIRFHHELRARDTDVLAATFVHGVRPTGPDVFDDAVIDAARDRVIDHPDYAATRTVDLELDLIATAPTLQELLDRGLAMRKPRTISADECRSDGSYETSFAPLLTWGGEAIDPAREAGPWIPGSDGRKLAWAAMENRAVIARWPRLGDRIQAFGAGVEMFDKVGHRLQWAFDLDTGEMLNAFEVVSLAFDIDARAPVSIPDEARQMMAAELQADLLPRRPAAT